MKSEGNLNCFSVHKPHITLVRYNNVFSKISVTSLKDDSFIPIRKVWNNPDYTDPMPAQHHVVTHRPPVQNHSGKRTPLRVQVKRATQFVGSGPNVKP